MWGFSDKNKVYLTFDDGPTEELTNWILQTLEELDVKATFFCVGNNAMKYPDLMVQIKEQGHQIGNHTMSHENGRFTSKTDYLKSIAEASRYTSSTLFRPPYGRLPLSYVGPIRRHYQIVMWSWLSYDFDKQIPERKILIESKKIKAGDILVFHDNLKVQDRLKALLPDIIAELKARGFQFAVLGTN